MIALMATSPHMQQLMMAGMPAAARNPETIKAILADEGMKAKLVQMLAKQNLKIPSHVLEGMTAGHMEKTFDRAAKMGVDPQALFARLMNQPVLLAKLQQPKIMSAFMDISTNPANAARYAGDRETMEVVAELRAALGHMSGGAPPPPSSEGGAPPFPSGPVITDVEARAVGSGSPPAAPAAAAPAHETETVSEPPAHTSGTGDAQPTEERVKPSRFVGVSWGKASSSWMVHLWNPDAQRIQHVGSYASEDDAARAYDDAALKMQGPDAKLNFPDGAPPPSGTPPPPGQGATAAGPPPPGGPFPGGLPGLSPTASPGAANLMTMMMTDPELTRRLANPRVIKAIEEVGRSPWKTIKYVFDKEVMEVFGALNNVMRGKDAWTGKVPPPPPPPPPTAP
ncbi:hypothetical protein FOA52_001086 [Chlamydomonas sp. UWO 241]|nr:hypothetical protein FOA52_001086 [Chlamydomonas sp. UWO 241]